MQKRKPYLVGKAFRNYLAASVLTVAATQVANIIDASIVGNLLGPEAFASVNLSKPVLQFFFAVSCLYVASSTLLAGIAIGKGDKTRANGLFSFSIIFSLIIGILFSVGGIAAFKSISALLCHSENLRPMTEEFMRVTILSAVPQLLMYTFDQFVTVDGSPKLVARAVIVGNIFNIVFDIVFIKIFGWGIAGAAWATFLMYIVCTLMVLPHFRRKDTLRFSLPGRGSVEYGKIFSYGLPFFFSTVLLSVQMIGNNYVAGKFLGDGGLIALAVCTQLLSFSMIILTGTLRTVQPVGSVLRGMDDNCGMRFLMRKAYAFLAICLTVYSLIIIFFPVQISGLLGTTNELSLPIIRKALPLFALNIIMQSLLYDLMPLYQFYGHKNLAIILSFGQPLLPMLGFWVLKGGWLGFFIGQAVVAVIILVCTAFIRAKDKSLMPLTLIPRGNPDDVYETTMGTSIEALGENTDGLREFLLARGFDKQQANRYVLCAEELLKNIIEHGHARYVDIRATGSAISIHDDGKPFNPLEYSENGEGLGLKIVHGIGFDLRYDYRFNQNMVTIKMPSQA